MEDEKSNVEFWTVKCYCEDEDLLLEQKVPFGISSKEYFEGKPTCNICGNHNLIPVEKNRPPEYSPEKTTDELEKPIKN